MADLLKDLDFFDLDEMLGHEERMVRDTVRQFVQREVLPSNERIFASETFPKPLVPQMAALGFFGANLKGYGCAGMNNIAYGLIMQGLEAGDSGLRSFASVQSALAMYSIYAWGSEEQKRRYLPEMAKGKLLGCFGLTEPDHGSDPGGMETRARRDAHGRLLCRINRSSIMCGRCGTSCARRKWSACRWGSSRTRTRGVASRSRSPSATTSARRLRSRGWRATCWGPTGPAMSTRSSVTC